MLNAKSSRVAARELSCNTSAIDVPSTALYNRDRLSNRKLRKRKKRKKSFLVEKIKTQKDEEDYLAKNSARINIKHEKIIRCASEKQLITSLIENHRARELNHFLRAGNEKEKRSEEVSAVMYEEINL